MDRLDSSFGDINNNRHEYGDENDYDDRNSFSLSSNFYPLNHSKTHIFQYKLSVKPAYKDDVVKAFLASNKQVLKGINRYYEEKNKFLFTNRQIDLYQIKNSTRCDGRNYTVKLEENREFFSFPSTEIDIKNFILYRLSKNHKIINSLVVLDEIEDKKIRIIFGYNILLEYPNVIFSNKIHVVDSNGQYLDTPLKRLPKDIKKKYSEYAEINTSTLEELFEWEKSKINSLLEPFGLALGNPLELKGRLIPAPKLEPQSKKFHKKPPQSIRWVLFSLDQQYEREKLRKFHDIFYEKSCRHGIDIEKCFAIEYLNVQTEEQIENIFLNLRNNNINYAIFGLREGSTINGKAVYEIIKCKGNSEYLVHSQVFVTDKTFEDPSSEEVDSYYDSLIMKMCLKMGGIPNIIHSTFWLDFPFEAEHTMLVGFYIHKQCFSTNSVYGFAMIATLDSKFNRYNLVTCFAQTKTFERRDRMIGEMLEKAMNMYEEENKKMPNNIIIFQDIYCPAKALTLFETKANLTIIEVDRRTPVKFFLKNPQSSNLPNGLSMQLLQNENKSIEPEIRQPSSSHNLNNRNYSSYKSFFISSSGRSVFSNQGDRITKYTVIQNDWKLSLSQIKNLCFGLCHIYHENFHVNDAPTLYQYACKVAKKSMYRFEGSSDPYSEFENAFYNIDLITRSHFKLNYSFL